MDGENGGFKHISVTSAAEDEVIVAGGGAAVGSPSPVADALGGSSAAEGAGAEAASDWAAGRKSDSPCGASGGRDAAALRDDAHRETALEDLESAPLPLTQKIVIIAAVVCIIGALIYYFVAMR